MIMNDAKQVLVIDDESTSRIVLEYLFKSLGYGVSVAQDGEEAIEIFQKEFFPYIVMDFHMPKMDGLVTTKAIREIEKSKNCTPAFIIGVTAEQGVKQQAIGLSAGMNVVHTKPVNLNIIKSILGC